MGHGIVAPDVRRLSDCGGNVASVGTVWEQEHQVTFRATVTFCAFPRVQDETGRSRMRGRGGQGRGLPKENRHRGRLHKWLYLSGRVDMRAVESTIQRLIGAGLQRDENECREMRNKDSFYLEPMRCAHFGKVRINV